jgi:uncharacterized membrane protein
MRALPKPKIAALLMGVWCLALLAFRIWYSRGTLYGFFVWNLFLAAVPLVLSTILLASAARRRNPVLEILLLLAWIAFLPNAPYMVTDLIHLEPLPPVPVWFDSLMLGSYALLGLLLTYLSVADVERVVTWRVGRIGGAVVAYLSLAACGFGIYAGRFLRWNTWDLLVSPEELWAGAIRPLTYPATHPRTWAVTVLYGAALMLGYFVLNSVAAHFGTPEPPGAVPAPDREASA